MSFKTMSVSDLFGIIPYLWLLQRKFYQFEKSHILSAILLLVSWQTFFDTHKKPSVA
jgi:hypothetical protein